MFRCSLLEVVLLEAQLMGSTPNGKTTSSREDLKGFPFRWKASKTGRESGREKEGVNVVSKVAKGINTFSLCTRSDICKPYVFRELVVHNPFVMVTISSVLQPVGTLA
jgi:hypothetical protein